MGRIIFVGQWASSPIPQNPEVLKSATETLKEVVDAERRKVQALKKRGRALDRSGCSQTEFEFLSETLRSVVCNGSD